MYAVPSPLESKVTYRDELRALRARKDALEAEVASLRDRQADAEAQRREIEELNAKVVRLEARLGDRPPMSPGATVVLVLVALLVIGAAFGMLALRGSSSQEVVVDVPSPDPLPTTRRVPGNVSGTVLFTGEELLPMEVPRERLRTRECASETKHNALLVEDRRIKDVLVWAEPYPMEGQSPPPVPSAAPRGASLSIRDCVTEPRVTAMQRGGTLRVENMDRTLHNVHARRGATDLFNVGFPMGAPALEKTIDVLGMVVVTDDIHVWERSFVMVLDSPYFAVSDGRGAFSLPPLPAGRYTLHAWHAFLGPKQAALEVVSHGQNQVTFEYDGSENEPVENRGELDDMF